MDQFYRFDNFAVRRLHNEESRVLPIDRRFSALEIAQNREGKGRSCPALLTIYPRKRVAIPPALRERNVRLRKFVSCGDDSMLHCGAIALQQ